METNNNVNNNLNNFIWNDAKVIDFVNWYVNLNELSFRYQLKNQEIIDSFKRGDSTELWRHSIYESLFGIDSEEQKEIENETDELLNSKKDYK